MLIFKTVVGTIFIVNQASTKNQSKTTNKGNKTDNNTTQPNTNIANGN